MNFQKYVEINILFILILFGSIFISKTSEFMYSIFIFFMVFFFVPGLIIYSFSDRPAGPLYSTIALLIALAVIPLVKFKIPPLQTRTLTYGTIMFLVALTLLPIVLRFGVYFNLKNIFFEEVYETRDLFSAKSSLGIDYLYNWLVKALIPLCLVFFLIHKQYKYAVISFFFLLYLYIISGNKIVYITLFVMLFFYFVGKDYSEKTRYFLVALIIGLIIMPVIDYYVIQSHSLKGIFVMRMLFLPSQLNYYYFDFFNGNPLYFAESNLFNMYLTYPYTRPIGFIISETYFRAPDMNANNGIISDGFMNLGYPGIALNILIVTVIFIFFNSVDPDSRYLGIFFVMIFLFLSAPMLSMFVTSGLWIVFLFSLTLMKRRREDAIQPK